MAARGNAPNAKKSCVVSKSSGSWMGKMRKDESLAGELRVLKAECHKGEREGGQERNKSVEDDLEALSTE
jgi:hypothetical protein